MTNSILQLTAGGRIVAQAPKTSKKVYHPPAFQIVDAHIAKAELEAKGTSRDAKVRQMLSAIDKAVDGKTSLPPSRPRGPSR